MEGLLRLHRIVVAVACSVSAVVAAEPATAPDVADSGGPSRTAVVQHFFADYCRTSTVCLRVKSSYADIRPDRSVYVVNGAQVERETTTLGRDLGALPLSRMFTDMTRLVPAELKQGVFGYFKQNETCFSFDDECLRSAWLSSNGLWPDGGGDADTDYRITAIGGHSALGEGPRVTTQIGTILGVIGTSEGETQIDGAYMVETWIKSWTVPGYTEVTREKAVVWSHTDARKAGIHHFQILDGGGMR